MEIAWNVCFVGIRWVHILGVGVLFLAGICYCNYSVPSDSICVFAFIRQDKYLQEMQISMEAREGKKGIVIGAFFVWG